MARHFFGGSARDTLTGQVRGGATITAYLADTLTLASIYTASTGGTAVNSVTTNTDGQFGFWVDEADYPLTQLFDLVSSKTGYTSITYENVPVFNLTAVDTDGTLAGNSDKKIASQKATKTYADTKVPNSYLDTDGTLAANSDSKVATQKATKTYVDGKVSDDAYGAGWDGVTTIAPSKNAVYDKINSLPSPGTVVSDAAYGSGWNGVTDVAPSKNAVYDKVETLVSDDAYGSGWDGDTDTAPSKNAVYDKVQLLGVVPAGTVLLWPTDTVPTGYKECNGQSLDRTTYADLYAAIGTVYGTADGTHFNVPDFRGRFPRFWDNSKANDPDRASRTVAGCTNTGATMTAGDHVGTSQADDYKAHTHTISRGWDGGGTENVYVTANQNSQYGDHADDRSTGTAPTSGGNETRPKNVNLMAIIKY